MDDTRAFHPAPSARSRPRKHDMREVLDAIFYISRGGCAWRLLPHEFPPWQTIYHYFRAWRRAGLWEQIHGALRARVLAGREAEPSACIIDSQSVKTTERGGVHGYDVGKKVGGRKRHIPVDTTGGVPAERYGILPETFGILLEKIIRKE